MKSLRKRWVGLFVAGGIVLTAWCAPANGAEPRPLALAPVAEISMIPVELFQPLCDYLTEELKRPVRLALPDNYSDLLDRFARGQIDIVFGGPHIYSLTRDRYGARALVMRRYEGSTQYRSYIFVRTASEVTHVQDLRGKRFAFTDELSTSGYLVPRIMLYEAGIPDPNAYFSEVRFEGTYLNVLESVLLGEVDAAAMASFRFEGFGIRNRNLRVIHKSPPITLGPVFVNALTLSPGEMEEIKRAFLAIGKTIRTGMLAKILGTSFIEVDEKEYAWVDDYRKVLATLPPVSPSPSSWVLPETPEVQASSRYYHVKIALIISMVFGLAFVFWNLWKRQFQGLGGRVLIVFLGLILCVILGLGGLSYLKEREILKHNTQEAGLLFTQAVMLASRDAVLREDRAYLIRYARALIQQRRMNLTFVEFHGKGGALLASAGHQNPGTDQSSIDITLPVMAKEDQRGEIRIGFSQERINDVLRETLLNVLLVTLVTTGVATMVAVGLTRRVTRPLAELTLYSQRIASGDLDQKVEIASNDEIGVLARAFNQMAMDLRDTTSRLCRQEKLADIGLMLAAINHRLRNPIAGINNYARLLQNKLSPTASGRKEVDRIREGTERIDDLLRQLSSPSYLELNIEPVDLNDIFNMVCGKVGSETKARGIRLEAECGPSLPRILGDRERLVEVFEHLLINAIDAIQERGGDEKIIRLTAQTEDREVLCYIEDAGCGIPEQDLQRIFDPFFTTKEKKGGTGLGLYFVYAIIERHGGKITVTSHVGKGTRFLVRLPALEE